MPDLFGRYHTEQVQCVQIQEKIILKKQPHILLIGPLPNLKANKIGGARVSFSYLVEDLREQNYPFTLIETQPYGSGWKQLLNPFLLILKFFVTINRVDVVWLNVSQGGTKWLAPMLYLLSKLFRKKFVFRPFGSSLKEDFQRYNSLHKWLFQKTVLRADLLFLQTHTLLDFFSRFGVNSAHFPTARKRSKINIHNFQKRFVFLGHIKESKGIDLILKAAKRLDKSYTIHFYGPIKDNKYEAFNKNNLHYKGVLPIEKVLPTLSNYDVLLLPTFFSGEGYPGAIIEAYSLGLAVIASRWRAIPEIVQDGETGLLIAPKSVEALVKAMQHFDRSNYAHFSEQAAHYFATQFEMQKVNRTALERIAKL